MSTTLTSVIGAPAARHPRARRLKWSLYEQPAKGWRGVGKVARRNKTRDRVQVLMLHGHERDAFLCHDGHPELVRSRRLAEADADGAA